MKVVKPAMIFNKIHTKSSAPATEALERSLRFEAAATPTRVLTRTKVELLSRQHKLPSGGIDASKLLKKYENDLMQATRKKRPVLPKKKHLKSKHCFSYSQGGGSNTLAGHGVALLDRQNRTAPPRRKLMPPPTSLSLTSTADFPGIQTEREPFTVEEYQPLPKIGRRRSEPSPVPVSAPDSCGRGLVRTKNFLKLKLLPITRSEPQIMSSTRGPFTSAILPTIHHGESLEEHAIGCYSSFDDETVVALGGRTTTRGVENLVEYQQDYRPSFATKDTGNPFISNEFKEAESSSAGFASGIHMKSSPIVTSPATTTQKQRGMVRSRNFSKLHFLPNNKPARRSSYFC